MAGLLNKLGADHLVYVHQLNLQSDSVLLVRLDDADLRNHSFLDQRVFRQDMNYEWLGWGEFEAAAETLPEKSPSYIFHTGHCGSTLLSRLVSAATDTQALREPLPLRAIAIDQAYGRAAILGGDAFHKRLSLFERVWSRGPASTVVKATSVCTNLMSLVDPAAPMVFIYQQPEIHLAAVLAGDNALPDLRGFAYYRYLRLLDCDVDLPPLAELSVGELAALSLLAEAVAANIARSRRSILMLDFDRLLQQPESGLAGVCRHIGLQAGPERCRAAVTGPIMRSYSKAPEYPYGPQVRNDLIADSRARNGGEIATGMQWINRLAASSAEVNTAVEALSSPAEEASISLDT